MLLRAQTGLYGGSAKQQLKWFQLPHFTPNSAEKTPTVAPPIFGKIMCREPKPIFYSIWTSYDFFGHLRHKLGSHQKVLNLYLPRFHFPLSTRLIWICWATPGTFPTSLGASSRQCRCSSDTGHAAVWRLYGSNQLRWLKFHTWIPQISAQKDLFLVGFLGPKVQTRLEDSDIYYWNVISSWIVCLSTTGQVSDNVHFQISTSTSSHRAAVEIPASNSHRQDDYMFSRRSL